MPASVTPLANELKQIMERSPSTSKPRRSSWKRQRLEEAEGQQALALDGFQRAEELFDQIRRQVIEEADKTIRTTPTSPT